MASSLPGFVQTCCLLLTARHGFGVVRTVRLTNRGLVQLSQVAWPTHAADPINEYTCESFLSRTFPDLFPYGGCQLRAPRKFSVTPEQYFQHLIRHHSGRFAQHRRFRCGTDLLKILCNSFQTTLSAFVLYVSQRIPCARYLRDPYPNLVTSFDFRTPSRYTGLNCMMRWRAASISKVFVQRSIAHKDLDDILDEVRNAQSAPISGPF
jgi:hypothetical protein